MPRLLAALVATLVALASPLALAEPRARASATPPAAAPARAKKARTPDTAPASPSAPASDQPLVRCTGPGGEVTWSNVGCGAGERAAPLQVKSPANVLDSGGLRAWAKRAPPARESAAGRRARERAAAPARVTRVYDTIACENAQRDYRFEAGHRGPRRGGMGVLRDEVKRACAR